MQAKTQNLVTEYKTIDQIKSEYNIKFPLNSKPLIGDKFYTKLLVRPFNHDSKNFKKKIAVV